MTQQPGDRSGRRPRRAQLDPARRAAFDVLRAVSERDAYANLALPALLSERGITGRDAAFATELTYGTCRSRGTLDAVIAAAASRPIDQIDSVLLDLLRLGAYQLLRTNVATHAAVSTTVEQAGLEFDSVRAGFVNGVLRTISKRDEQSWLAELAPAADTDPVGHAAFTHAHPRWIAQAFTMPANSTRRWPPTMRDRWFISLPGPVRSALRSLLRPSAVRSVAIRPMRSTSAAVIPVG